jgi:hypothetical protein
MDNQREAREHVLDLLKGGHAHASFDDAVAGLPEELRGKTVPGLPYSAWQLLEHLRISQWDILEFSRDSKHVSPDWPKGYWPSSAAPPDDGAWGKSVAAFKSDHQEMMKLVQDPRVDLHAKIPHGTGQTILREALLVADHNSYHIGQLVMLRRLLGVWEN